MKTIIIAACFIATGCFVPYKSPSDFNHRGATIVKSFVCSNGDSAFVYMSNDLKINKYDTFYVRKEK